MAWSKVNYAYAASHPKNGWADLDEVSVWRKGRPHSPHGVINVLLILAQAKCSGKKVDFSYENSDHIGSVYL